MLGLKKDRETFDRWMACFRRAIELDPDYSAAYAGMSMGYSLDHQNRWSDKPELSLGEAERFADAAIAKDDKNPYAHFAASMAAMNKKDYRRWADQIEKALSLNPNYAPAMLGRGGELKFVQQRIVIEKLKVCRKLLSRDVHRLLVPVSGPGLARWSRILATIV